MGLAEIKLANGGYASSLPALTLNKGEDTMIEQTQEQVKKIILWLGGEESNSGFVRLLPDFDWHHISYWEKQVKSLDFLFKYAVPKLEYLKLYKAEHHLDYGVEVTLSSKKVVRLNPDPALALFWAIWEVVKK